MDDTTDTHAANNAPANDTPGEDEMRELMEARLAELRVEHRRIDTEIEAARETGMVDMLKIARMKKIKLRMRDQIAWLENQLTPDIIA